MNLNQRPANLADLRRILAALPAADHDFANRARERSDQLTKPPGSLGELEALAVWLGAWQRAAQPVIRNPVVVVFAANHGIAKKGVSAFPPEVTAQMVANFSAGGAAINQLVRAAGASLAIVDAGVSRPTADFSETEAMSEADFMEAFLLGMEAVPKECDLFAAGEMGIGNTTSAAALCFALYGESAGFWTGPGTGVQGERLDAKIRLVDTSVARHLTSTRDPLELFCRIGGKELAAIAGAVLEARLRRVPVVLDGFICCAALAPLAVIEPGFLAHCCAGHVSCEPGHRQLLKRFNLRPVLDLGMRLGEGSGAAIAMAVIKAAAACHAGMATFAEADVARESR